MKKILLSIAAAACLASFAVPVLAQDTGDKSPAKSKAKSMKEKKEKKEPEGEKKPK